MNHREDQRMTFVYNDDQHTYNRAPQIISTVALLVTGYLVISFLDVWPSTTKRNIYEWAVRLTPSPFIFFLQHVMIRLGRLSHQDASFLRNDFGQFRAKEEALQRMVFNTSMPRVLRRARTLSGYDKLGAITKEKGPPGLGNWDNSCYQNSILQGLASLPAFQHYIQRCLRLSEQTRTDTDTTAALASFLDQLSNASSHQQTIWTPKILKSMDSWQQQDAQEYFSRILEAVEKETARYADAINRSVDRGLATLRPRKRAKTLAKAEAARKLLYSLVRHPMNGMFAQSLTCQTCGFSEGVSLTQFNCLTVNLGLGGSRPIEDLMDEYTEPELIEGVECDSCTRIVQMQDAGNEETGSDQRADRNEEPGAKKQLRVKAKQITLGRLPTNLVIHINRSIWDDYGNQVKNPSFVYFQPRLVFIDQWCALSGIGANPVQAVYELKCTVTHSGRHDNGHYVAYGKRGKDWYCFNDEIVTALSEQQVLKRGNVFMLFYERIQVDEAMINEGREAVVTEGQAKDVDKTESMTGAHLDIQKEPSAIVDQTLVPGMTADSVEPHDEPVGPASGLTIPTA